MEVEETSRGCGAGGGRAETKGNQLQNFLKAERGPGARSAACGAGEGAAAGPWPARRGHHDQRDPEEELQQAGPAEPHQVSAHLPGHRAAPGCGWSCPRPAGKGSALRTHRRRVSL